MTEQNAFRKPSTSLASKIIPLTPSDIAHQTVRFKTSDAKTASCATQKEGDFENLAKEKEQENLKKLLFTARLHEGCSREEIEESKADSDEDTEKDEDYTFSPLNFGSFVDIHYKPDTFLSDLYMPLEESDSDSEAIDLRLFSDSSETETSDTESVSLLSLSDIFKPKMGNLPNFDQLSSDSSTEVPRGRIRKQSTLPVETSLPQRITQFGDPGSSKQDVPESHSTTNACLSSNSPYCTTHIQYRLFGKLLGGRQTDVFKSSTKLPSCSELKTSTSQKLKESDFYDVPKSYNCPSHRSQRTETATSENKIDLEKDKNTRKEIPSESDRSDFREIERAFEKFITEGSLTPMLKHELKMKIQFKRLERGQSELVLGQHQLKTYELRPDEIEKRNKRLYQNRISAQKCRQRLREHTHKLKKEIKRKMTDNAKLSVELKRLQTEHEALLKAFNAHKMTCSKCLK